MKGKNIDITKNIIRKNKQNNKKLDNYYKNKINILSFKERYKKDIEKLTKDYFYKSNNIIKEKKSFIIVMNKKQSITLTKRYNDYLEARNKLYTIPKYKFRLSFFSGSKYKRKVYLNKIVINNKIKNYPRSIVKFLFQEYINNNKNFPGLFLKGKFYFKNNFSDLNGFLNVFIDNKYNNKNFIGQNIIINKEKNNFIIKFLKIYF